MIRLVDKMSLLRAFMGALRSKGAVINQHWGRPAETGCGCVGRGTGGDSESL